jgi:hypothetical protein
VNLVEWLKRMVAERRVEEVVDPRLPEAPPSKVLKRAVLAALRCVDPDGSQRPTMGHVVHMLEDDLRFRDVRRRSPCSFTTPTCMQLLFLHFRRVLMSPIAIVCFVCRSSSSRGICRLTRRRRGRKATPTNAMSTERHGRADG